KVVTTLSTIEVNERLDESLFKDPFPPGTRVSDEIEGVGYRIGKDGTPDRTKAVPLKKALKSETDPSGPTNPESYPVRSQTDPTEGEGGWSLSTSLAAIFGVATALA